MGTPTEDTDKQPDSDALVVHGRPARAFLWMAAVLFAKVVIARWLAISPATSLIGLLSEAFLVVALLAIVELLFWRWRFIAYITFDVLFSISLVALTEYARFFERMPAPGALRVAGQIGSITPSIIALLVPAYALFFIDLPALFVWRKREPALASGRTPRAREMSIALVSCLFVAAMAVVWAELAPTSTDEIAVAGARGVLAVETAEAARAALGSIGLAPVRERTGGVLPESVKATLDYGDHAAVQKLIDDLSSRGPVDRIAKFPPGRYAGANIIAIQVESLQDIALTSWVTPFLYRLSRESWYYPNGFTQAGLGTTSDAEFAMNSSLYPPTNNPASVEYVGRIIPALPRLLTERGYATFTMHANLATYWNRKELYPALGFGSYYDRTFYGRDNLIGMGMSDRQFFKRSAPIVIAEAIAGPFYAQLITLSPHHPFIMPRGTVKLELPDWLQGSILGRYLGAMNYEDRQIEMFVGKLKDSGLWDSSIVVIYGDHAGLRTSDISSDADAARMQRFLKRAYSPVDRARIPIIVHLPGQQTGVYCASTAGQVDIMPTIADALGLDLSDTPHFGRSLFENSRPLLAARSGLPRGSFINDRFVVVSGADFKSSKAVSIATKLESKDLTQEDELDWDAVRELQALSDAYVMSLPDRVASQGTTGAVIPRKLNTPPKLDSTVATE